MAAAYGWRACFMITASTGFVLALAWWVAYRPPEAHRSVNPQELAYITSDKDENPAAPRLGWVAVLKYKETWGFAAGKFLADPVWWFYLSWLPLYLVDARGFDMTKVGWALPIVYLMADVGSVAGGWLSGFFIRRGWHHATARKAAMAVCCSLMPIAAMSVLAPSAFLAVALVSLATAGHQGWSCNLFTTVSDVFPKPAIASVTGIGGAFGGLGGVLFSSLLPGYIVSHFGYTPIFLIMGCFHLLALLSVHLLLGRMEPIKA
jgi:ACS family hexuronate transporter-like MFS transporter